ncbi:helix-turn-helix domain-containing protein [Faucicola mancuniensis]
MNKLISINEASKQLGVSISTLRRWGKSGMLVAQRTPKGHRRYDKY